MRHIERGPQKLPNKNYLVDQFMSSSLIPGDVKQDVQACDRFYRALWAMTTEFASNMGKRVHMSQLGQVVFGKRALSVTEKLLISSHVSRIRGQLQRVNPNYFILTLNSGQYLFDKALSRNHGYLPKYRTEFADTLLPELRPFVVWYSTYHWNDAYHQMVAPMTQTETGLMDLLVEDYPNGTSANELHSIFGQHVEGLEGVENLLHVHTSNIRTKLSESGFPYQIGTMEGFGYTILRLKEEQTPRRVINASTVLYEQSV